MVLPSISEMGDQRWRRLLDSHDDLARQIIEKHRGSLVKSTGEGILAVFDGPSRAVINSPMLPNMKKERGRIADALYPEQVAGRGQGIELAAGAKRHDLSGDAAVLAEDRTTFDPAAGGRHLEATRNKAGRIERPRERPPEGGALENLIPSAPR